MTKLGMLWDYRWGRNIDCGAPLASMVAYECGAIA